MGEQHHGMGVSSYSTLCPWKPFKKLLLTTDLGWCRLSCTTVVSTKGTNPSSLLPTITNQPLNYDLQNIHSDKTVTTVDRLIVDNIPERKRNYAIAGIDIMAFFRML